MLPISSERTYEVIRSLQGSYTTHFTPYKESSNKDGKNKKRSFFVCPKTLKNQRTTKCSKKYQTKITVLKRKINRKRSSFSFIPFSKPFLKILYTLQRFLFFLVVLTCKVQRVWLTFSKDLLLLELLVRSINGKIFQTMKIFSWVN